MYGFFHTCNMIIHITRSSEDGVDAKKLVAIAQEQLRKRNYEGFAKLIESFQQADMAKWVKLCLP